MAKIGTRLIPVPNGSGKKIEAILYYFDQDKHDKFFFIDLPEAYREEISGKLQRRHIRGRNYVGLRGDSEATLMQEAEAYIKWFVTENVKKVPVILIETEDSRNNKSVWRFNPKWEVDIKFEFTVAYYVEAGGERQYYRDTYHGKDNLNRNNAAIGEHTVKNCIEVPYSDELLAKCEELVEQFHKVNDKVRMLFGSTEQATATLEGSRLKLIG